MQRTINDGPNRMDQFRWNRSHGLIQQTRWNWFDQIDQNWWIKCNQRDLMNQIRQSSFDGPRQIDQYGRSWYNGQDLRDHLERPWIWWSLSDWRNPMDLVGQTKFDGPQTTTIIKCNWNWRNKFDCLYVPDRLTNCNTPIWIGQIWHTRINRSDLTVKYRRTRSEGLESKQNSRTISTCWIGLARSVWPDWTSHIWSTRINEPVGADHIRQTKWDVPVLIN